MGNHLSTLPKSTLRATGDELSDFSSAHCSNDTLESNVRLGNSTVDDVMQEQRTQSFVQLRKDVFKCGTWNMRSMNLGQLMK